MGVVNISPGNGGYPGEFRRVACGILTLACLGSYGCAVGPDSSSFVPQGAATPSQLEAQHVQRAGSQGNPAAPNSFRNIQLFVAAAIARQRFQGARRWGDGGGKFGKVVDRLANDLSATMVNFCFIERVWFLNSAAASGFVGRRKPPGEDIRQAGIHLRSFACVTSPVKAFGDRVLVVASVLPYRVEILSVNRYLHVRLLFDSDDQYPASLRGVTDGVGPLYEVKVLKPDVFLLYEGAEAGWPEAAGGPHGSHGRHPYARHVRVFVIDFPRGQFRIRLLRRRSK
jgi:hypothetical protein